ncbi:MAG: hypothetical protein ACOC05_09345 [Oceanicaulis sp.]
MGTDLAILAGLAFAGSLALGVPLRLFGWKVVWGSGRNALGWIRRHRFLALLVLVIGALAGLWTFDSIRDLVFGLILR